MSDTVMEDISPEALQLLMAGAPRYLKAIQDAALQSRQRNECMPVLLTLDGFYDDPMLLYASVWYAYSQGVAITFVPREVDVESKEIPILRKLNASE